MIFITADTHGELERLTDRKLNFIKKYDTLIVLGDFGFVWSGDKQQEKNLKKISKLPFKVLFIDGYNENFKALEQYPDTVYRGAQAKEICPGQVYYIKRGEVLEIDDMKLLCFGGADDFMDDVFSDYPPSQADFDNCTQNLDRHGWKVDYVLTHSPSGNINRFINMDSFTFGHLFDYLDEISTKLDYKKWYFGFYHKNKYISSKAQAVYTDVYKLGD